MSHCLPCIGANRIRDAKSRKYILITFAVFVNRIQGYFIKILKEKAWAKTFTIAISWIHVPVASKLGLRPQTVSPRRHISSHEMTQSFSMFCSGLFLFNYYMIRTPLLPNITPAPAPANSQIRPAFASALLPSPAAVFSPVRSVPWTRLNCAPCGTRIRCLQYGRQAYRPLPFPNRICKSF